MSVDSPEVAAAPAAKEPGALQALLSPETDPETFAYAWLDIQCACLEGVRAGVVLLVRSGEMLPVAKWPLTARVAGLLEAARAVQEERTGIVLELENGHAVGYPMLRGDDITGVVVLDLGTAPDALLHAALSQLQWSVIFFELFDLLRQSGDQRADGARAREALGMLSRVQAQPDFSAAAMLLVTELAGQFRCTRVSMGHPRAGRVRLEAVSHSARPGAGLKLDAAIARAMEEAMVLGGIQNVDADSAQTLPDHQALMSVGGAGNVLTLPVYLGERYYWVFSFERDAAAAARPFDEEEIRSMQAICVLVAGALDDKRFRHRAPLLRMLDAAREGLGSLFGPRHLTAKLATLAAAVLAGLLVFLDGEYRITADTLIEGQVQRVVAAPFGGYIAEALVKAGDVVAENDVLARLDDSDLRLERQNWVSQRSQYRRQYDQAFAEFERADVNVAEARIAQATAQIALVERKLQRSRMRAPFAGIVIEGDLSQRLGAYVEKGEVLFVLAPLKGYRVILLVDEGQIADVRKGQRGELVLAARPDEIWAFRVDAVTPVTEAAEGRNRFRVEASLLATEDALSLLRPGMEGVAKIGVDERRLWWIWTREFRDWWTLTLWRWWP